MASGWGRAPLFSVENCQVCKGDAWEDRDALSTASAKEGIGVD